MKKWDSVDQLITLERLKNNNLLNNGPQTPIFSEIRQVHCQTSLELMEKLEKKKRQKNPLTTLETHQCTRWQDSKDKSLRNKAQELNSAWGYVPDHLQI